MNTRTVYVPTPGGTALATDVCLPDGTRPLPAVLIRTPYGREAHRAELRGWAAHGFAALAQDVRGRHGSPGEWHPYRDHERTDGAATVAWVRAQAWSNGEVVAVGASYAAYCALVTALAAPEAACDAGPDADLDSFHRDGVPDNLRRDGVPGDFHRDGVPDAVIAAVPALGLTETAREPGGPERLWARAGWWAAHGDRRDSDPDALARALADDPRLLEHLPVARLAERLAASLGRELPSWSGLWADRARGRLVALGSTARLPLLAVGGTRDPFAEDTVALWRGWGGPSRLLLGPWGHRLTTDPAAPARARVNLGALYVRWARAALAGRLEPTRHGAIALGDSGRWHSTRLRSTPRPASTQDATPQDATAQEGAEWRAGADRPEAESRWSFDSPTGLRLLHGAEFNADPDRPVRSDDLAVPADGERADRCLLLSPPLPRPLDLAGAAVARINVTADTPCADWAVRLTALDPTGRADPLAFGIVRRTGPPGEAADISVPLGTLGRRLPAGTRLRAEIAGHHFPAHARNPHTGEDPVTATRLAPSRRTVNPRGSALHLPVVARRRYVEPAPEICR
ncbi:MULTISPECIES: CocE/NonD family hydrolase [Streptomyces]|uniref:CocE/NonD family hydrolase n=1 Tax=Streptomyces TaxID=1883 RepID=UPI0008518CF7|nr:MULTISPECIES: CocE/NonD family hydrolase [unclassified Streptomyces]MBQ1106090.1 CocE/NonD family hydrolase [Streptomyces sp. 404i]MDX3484819.1 CocE/NonD family hydrolase [Streptomyces sp. ID05-18]